ncbi:LAMI_0H09428g1_1 [Lachancea mirantina]|uniref:AP complex subunit beta n=1 Tax=Lachancea mirantina TaxID=1230905 RepID=A0A1G4KGF6_9SACH|nr:LAMI_0H09428g1_1 [Lachancea mirantina]
MSDQRVFTRHKAYEIRAELQQADNKRFKASAARQKNALKKIIANITMGYLNEMASLFPEILKFWSIDDDMEVKMACHQYALAMAPTKSSHFEEALKLIQDDFASSNERLRIMALNTLSSIPRPSYYSACQKCLESVLTRSSESADLKRAALHAILNMDQADKNSARPYVSFLSQIINEQRQFPSVRAHALSVLDALNESHKDLPPMSLSHDTCFNLLELLPELNEWDHTLILNGLTANYVPQTHSESHHLIEVVLPHLQHVNTSVSLAALKLILYLINYVDSIHESIVKRLSSSVVALLNKPSELQFLVLRNVILLLLGRDKPFLQIDVSYFFVEFNDPIYIKDTKLEILYLLAKEDNLRQILQELKDYATDIDIQMSRKAIRAIGNLAVKLENSVDDCINVLLDLLDFGVEYIIQEIISVFRNVMRKYPEQDSETIKRLVAFNDSVQEPESRSAMIWIITQFSRSLPNFLTLFRVFSDNFGEESLEVQFSVLNSSVKFFVRTRSSETEELCLKILKTAVDNADNPDLRERALMYWRLLSLVQQRADSNISLDDIVEIVDGELPLITLNTRLDPAVLEELELNIGSIASIYLKPIGQVFRLNRTMTLPQSPVLNRNRDSLEMIPDTRSSKSSASYSDPISTRSRAGSSPVKKMNDHDKPAETVNHLKMKRRTTIGSSKVTRKPSILSRRISIKRPFT